MKFIPYTTTYFCSKPETMHQTHRHNLHKTFYEKDALLIENCSLLPNTIESIWFLTARFITRVRFHFMPEIYVNSTSSWKKSRCMHDTMVIISTFVVQSLEITRTENEYIYEHILYGMYLSNNSLCTYYTIGKWDIKLQLLNRSITQIWDN